MSLSTFANENAFSESSTGDFMNNDSSKYLGELFENGPKTESGPHFKGRRKINRMKPGYEPVSESFLATIFWQVITEADFFHRLSRRLKDYEDIIVFHGEGQYSLIIWADEPEFAEPRVLELKDLNIDITSVVKEWIMKIPSNFEVDPDPKGIFWSNQVSRFYSELKYRDNRLNDFVTEIIENQNHKIIITQAPERNYLKSIVPSPFAGVCQRKGENATSTAGIYTRNTDELRGVTVALHALDDPNQGDIIYVDNLPGKIISINEITDSVFVELPGLDRQGRNNLKGPLKDVSPREQPAYFEGLRTIGTKEAIIDSWVRDITVKKRGVQKRVFTNLVANPGDSGSALVDSDGYIIGFAFYNSGISDRYQATSWIWADSVFEAHNLTWGN